MSVWRSGNSSAASPLDAFLRDSNPLSRLIERLPVVCGNGDLQLYDCVLLLPEPPRHVGISLRPVSVREGVRSHREKAGKINIVSRKVVFLEPGNAVLPIKIVLYDCFFVFSLISVLGFNSDSLAVWITGLGEF